MDKNIYLSQRKEQIVLVASSGVLYPNEGCRNAAPRTAKLVCRESEKINDLFDAIELKQLGLKVVKYWPLWANAGFLEVITRLFLIISEAPALLM